MIFIELAGCRSGELGSALLVAMREYHYANAVPKIVCLLVSVANLM
jgi:hypothetical protein